MKQSGSPKDAQDTSKRTLRTQAYIARGMVIWTAVKPTPAVWQGAAAGLITISALILGVYALSRRPATDSWATFAFLAIFLAGVLLSVAGGMAAALLLRAFTSVPLRIFGVLMGCLLVLTVHVFGEKTSLAATLVLVMAVSVPALLIGAGLWAWIAPGQRRLTRAQRVLSLAAVLIGGAALLGETAWYLWPGPSLEPSILTAGRNQTALQPVQAEDPSQPGPYAVKMLTYGSGQDRQRVEFGAEVSLLTSTVDGTAFVANWSGLSGALRTRYWGFDASHLPINGRVWYPAGEGPFPLVLIVHGNHTMTEYSDTGYEYLGELLASRGMITVSVDQNFLNSNWTNIHKLGISGLRDEDDARGWLLLEHLDQWRAWNAIPDQPFHGKVDLSRVALIGHSRGGEAIAAAAAFNKLPFYPDDATIAFDYDFDIRALVALAPIDGQYRPTGQPIRLEDINYLTLQGAYDSDVVAFEGIRQYNRVTFADGGGELWFKAALYVARANHGQFNTVWGRTDYSGFPDQGLFNLTPIMPAEQQMQIIKVFVAGFLETALNSRREYLPMFRNAQTARQWLPPTAFLTRYADSDTKAIATYEEDIDPTTGTAPGVTIHSDGLTLWRERLVRLRTSDQQSKAVTLGWNGTDEENPAHYSLLLPGSSQPAATSTLVFSLADANTNPDPKNIGHPISASSAATVVPKQNVPQGSELIDLTVEVIDGSGNTARQPLSSFAALPPYIEFHPMKARFLETTAPTEIVFQHYEFSLATFQAANPQFDPADLVTVRFVFDRSVRGAVVLDDLGFRK